MAASHGSNADFYCNGYVLSDYLNSASFSASRDGNETTTFKKKSKTYIPGLKDTTMSAEGIYDGDVDAVDDVLWAALSQDIDGLASYIPTGNELVGNKVYSMDTIDTSYEINTEVGEVAQISAEFQAGSAGRFSRGSVARPFGVAASGGNSTFVDNGASSSGRTTGLVVHVVASNNLVLKVQHASASAGTYVDLPGTLTFTSGRGSKRLVIPAQTVDRYTRVLWTGTGTFVAIIER